MPPTSLHIVSFDNTLDFDIEALNEHLHANQRQRLARLKGKRVWSFFWGRLLLQKLLVPTFTVKATEWEIIEQQDLPPKLVGKHAQLALPSFSISHCQNTLALAMSESAIGLDVEGIDSQRSINIAAGFCNTRQLDQLEQLEESEARIAMITLWTQKEAWFKQRCIPILNSRLKNLELNQVSSAQADVFSSKLANNMMISVCTDQTLPAEVTVHRASFEGNCAAINQQETLPINWQSFKAEMTNYE